jgi:ribosomal protein S4E
LERELVEQATPELKTHVEFHDGEVHATTAGEHVQEAGRIQKEVTGT